MHFLRGVVAKILVYTLFGLLIVSFAIWGIGDIFRGGGQDTTVATVGDRQIEETEFRRVMAQEYNALQQQLGQRLDPEMARAIGLPRQVLNQLVVDNLFAYQAEDMGLVVSEDAMRQSILNDPRFRDQLGNFDRTRFQAFLRSQGLSEAGYLQRLQAQIVRDRVVQALSSGVEVPRTLAETIYRYRNQTRVADYVELRRETVGAIQDPDEEALQSFYEQKQDDYLAPEYRSATYIHLRPEALFPEMAVSDEELRTAYEERKDQLGTPERRAVSQMVFETREAADEAVARLDQGADFAELARELTGQPPIDFGTVTRAELPGELAQAAFEIGSGETSLPVETDFGWHLLRVGEVQPGDTPSFESVKEELREDLLMAQAVDDLVSVANQLDDELASGATLEEAAETLNLPLETLEAVSREGRTPAGEAAQGLGRNQRFLETAFATEAGESSLLLETDAGGYFVVRVDGVTPAAPEPLEEIRDRVVADWKAEERDQRLLERAGELAARLREGQTLSGVAEDEGLEVMTTQPLTRDEVDPNVTPSARLAGQLFGLEPGESTVATSPDGQLVAVLTEIIPADPQANAEQVTQLQGQLANTLSNDLLNLYGTALQRDYGVSIDQAAVERVMSSF
jgi:peptidyl-prolyl cis-trans isomerase D